MKLYQIIEGEQTSMQDFIITRYELGEITYEEALAQIREISDDIELPFWRMELGAAKELKLDSH